VGAAALAAVFAFMKRDSSSGGQAPFSGGSSGGGGASRGWDVEATTTYGEEPVELTYEKILVPGDPGWAEGYMCTTCGKYFATARELNHHRANEHLAPGTVTFCPYCDEMFFTSDAVGLNGYKMHMMFYHQVEVK